MMRDPLACGDLIAHRRYAYARAAAAEGDFAAAAEVLEQALERVPGWAPALFALGEARQRLGDASGAVEAFRACLAADPEDAQGAAARIALIAGGAPTRALPRAYVARLFDDYAPRFDAHLVGALGYRGPTLIGEALDLAAPGRRFARALDLGCGTGLCGAALRARVERLEGVDLSAGMIAKARAGGLYETLTVGDIVDHLRDFTAAFDLIVAADVLTYLGDLRPAFAAMAGALAPGGLLAVTVETLAGDGFRLGAAMRFAHARTHVESCAAEAGLEVRLAREASTRREAGEDAPGLTVVLGL